MASPSGTSRHAALLRGINVGGKNKLPMPELAALCTRAGCLEVSTYIQSGNVIFSAKGEAQGNLGARIHAAIAKKFGLNIPVVLRSGQELAAALAKNPFAGQKEVLEDNLFVMFLGDTPTKDAVAKLNPRRSPPDVFRVVGKEIYLHLLNGAARSKLTNAYFDARLATVSTARNWRTLKKLVELTGG